MNELTQEEKKLLGSLIANELFYVIGMVANKNMLGPTEITPYVEALAKWFVIKKPLLEDVKRLAETKS